MTLNSDLILLQQIPFLIDYDLQVFKDALYPDNQINFSAFRKRPDGVLELGFDPAYRNLDCSWSNRNTIDAEKTILLPPTILQVNSVKSELARSAINQWAKVNRANFRVPTDAQKRQLSGEPILLTIEKEVFAIKYGGDEAVRTDQSWRMFYLKDLQRIPGTLDLILPYRIRIQNLATDWKEVDESVTILLPGLGITQTYASTRQLMEPPIFHWIDYPLPMAIKAIRMDDTGAMAGYQRINQLKHNAELNHPIIPAVANWVITQDYAQTK